MTSRFYIAKHINAPRRSFTTPESSKYGETIVDFFLYLLSTYGADTSQVLTTFIKSILTNPDQNVSVLLTLNQCWLYSIFLKLTNEEFALLLDVGVKYESEIYKATGTSLIPWLEECSYAKDVVQRSNSVEFLSKMLLLDVVFDPGALFESETPLKPRQVEILKILFEKIIDVNNGVKQKALNGLIKGFNSGNKTIAEILRNAFDRNRTEEEDEICGEIRGLIHKLFHLLNNPLAHCRRAVILLLEVLATRNPDIIDCHEFRTVIMELPDDGTILVRKQSLIILNSLLEKFPNHAGLIELWTRSFLILIKDSDVKIVELAMNVSFWIVKKWSI